MGENKLLVIKWVVGLTIPLVFILTYAGGNVADKKSKVADAINYYDHFYTGIDDSALIKAESDWNADAVNKKTGATGLGQIMPIALKDYNNMNPSDQYQQSQLKDAQINQKITYWTLTQRIPSLLQSIGVEVTPQNVIWAYHDGIGNVRRGKLSDGARSDIRRYLKALGGGE